MPGRKEADITPMESPHPYEDLPMLVLTGVGRSGTTALRKALSTHPGIISTGHEHNVAFDVLECARRNRTEFSRRYAMQTSDARHDALFRGLLFDLVFPDPQPAAQGRCTMLFTNLFPETATYLTEAFPKAKIVCLVRDGVEVIASRKKHEHFGGDDFERHCRIWTNAADMLAWSQGRDDAMLIRHEHLRADPELLCARIASFVGLENDAGAAKHLCEHTYHPTNHDGPAWASWSSAERRTFEEICSQSMKKLGYTIPWQTEQSRAG